MNLQFDAAGQLIEPTIEVQLEKPDSSAYGANVIDVNALNKTLRETSEHISDPHKMDRVKDQHEIDLVTFDNLDLIIGNLEDAGRDVPARMREERAQLRIQLTMSSASLRAAGYGDSDEQ